LGFTERLLLWSLLCMNELRVSAALADAETRLD
jgi:hypothetical protein